MNYQNMGLFGNAVKYGEITKNAWRDSFDPEKGILISLVEFDVHLNVNSRHVERYRKRLKSAVAGFQDSYRLGYFWRLEGLYYYKRLEMDSAIDALRKSREYHEKSAMMDDVVRSRLAETFVLIETARFADADRAIREIKRLSKGIESKNIAAEQQALILAYHYHRHSSHAVLRKYIERCEESMKGASEVPLLLKIERILFRARARIGDESGAKRVFDVHLRRVKEILSNMPDQEYAADFLKDPDESLVLKEYKLLRERKKG